MCRILLAVDNIVLGQALARVLEQEANHDVVTITKSMDQPCFFADDYDIAVIDLDATDGISLPLVKKVHKLCPSMKILVFVPQFDAVQIAAAIEAGVLGVLDKSTSLDEFVTTLRRIAAGEWLLTQREIVDFLRLAAAKRDEEYNAQKLVEQLTPREVELLRTLATGRDSKEIARYMGISIETERTHMVNILNKLGLHTRLQALIFACRHRIVELN